MRLVFLLLMALATVGVALGQMARKTAATEAHIERWEALALEADYGGLSMVVREAGQVLGTEERAPGTIAAVDSRAELLIYALYTGRNAQRVRAHEALEIAIEREPLHPAVIAADALWNALEGDPERALSLVESAQLPGVLNEWGAVATAAARTRTGDLAGAERALQGHETPLALAWRARSAWESGDVDGAGAAAEKLLTLAPDHRYGDAMMKLVRSRSMAPKEARALLAPLVESPDLPARVAEVVVVEVSRVLRRAGRGDDADQLLNDFLAQDDGAPFLLSEQARAHRFAGNFGAARAAADKGLRTRADDPQLLAEFAAAAFFNDAVSTIEDRTRKSHGASDSDGVRRAEAMVHLIQERGGPAAAGVAATRHLGLPGDAELWLAEAHLASGKPAEARKVAAQAAEKLAAAVGADSREVAIAQMYEGLAAATDGDVEGGRAILGTAWSPETRSPWGAWLFGRFHEQAGSLDDARSAYLLACHNGQDFALGCYDLARLYDSLPGGSVRKRTQREARAQYLRVSPKGWRAVEVRDALQGQ